MTKQQQRTLEMIKKDIPHFDFYNSDNYEVKTFDAEELSCGDIYIYFVTGLKNDEGTYASVFGRKKRHALIGKRGGIKTITKKLNYRAVSRFDFMNSCYEH